MTAITTPEICQYNETMSKAESILFTRVLARGPLQAIPQLLNVPFESPSLDEAQRQHSFSYAQRLISKTASDFRNV